MQWVESVINFFRFVFRHNAFKAKYKTKPLKMLPKIIAKTKWQIVDLRNVIDFDDHHLDGAINIPNTDFYNKYYKKLTRGKRILIISQNYRSHLDIYKFLRTKFWKAYILYANYDDIRASVALDQFCKVKVIPY